MKQRGFFVLWLVLSIQLPQLMAQPRSISNVRVAKHDTIQSETAIAIHPLNNDRLIVDWNDYGNGTWTMQKVAFSSDAGKNFVERNSPNAPPNYPNHTLSFDPSISIDRNGIMYASYVASNGVDILGFTCVGTSTNNGSNWTVVKVSSPETKQDKPWNVVDNTTGLTYSGNIYVSWTDFSSGSKIKLATSSDGGANFSTPVDIETKAPTANKYAYSIPIGEDAYSDSYVQASMPAVGPNGHVYVVWANIGGWDSYNASTIKIAVSTDGGSSFVTQPNVAQFTYGKFNALSWKMQSFPSVAVDPDGTIYVAYVDKVNGYQRVKFKASSDEGESFTSVAFPTVGSAFHLFPTVSVDDQGIVSVAFLYSSSSGENASVDVYYTESADHGTGFSTPVRVSSQSSQVLSLYFPDYIQMVSSTDGHRYVCWTDNRSGDNSSRNPNVYVGDINFGPATPQNLSVASSSRFNGKAKLTWSANTEAEMQQSGAVYEIYRKAGSTGGFGLLTTVSYTITTYTDEYVTVGSGGLTIYYRIRAKGSNNYHSPFTSEVGIGSSNWQERIDRQPDIVLAPQVPDQFELAQNYPNPFNPNTRISYGLPEAGIVHLTVFDYLGRDVATLVNEYKDAGYYEVNFDALNLSSGIYFYRIQAGTYRAVKKMLLMK